MTQTAPAPTSATTAAPADDLRVAVVGVGQMGADHVRRLATTTVGARPTVVADAFGDTVLPALRG